MEALLLASETVLAEIHAEKDAQMHSSSTRLLGYLFLTNNLH